MKRTYFIFLKIDGAVIFTAPSVNNISNLFSFHNTRIRRTLYGISNSIWISL